MPTANHVRRRRNSGSNDEPAPTTLNVPRSYPNFMTRSSSTSRLIGMLSTSPNDGTNLPQLTSMSPPLITPQSHLSSMPILQPSSTFDLRPELPSTSGNRDLSPVSQRTSLNLPYSKFDNKEIEKLISRTRSMLVIESLILLICQQREPDPSRQISLFNSVCSVLESYGFLGSTHKIEVLYQTRRMFGFHLHQLINDKLSQVVKSTNVIGDRQITSQITQLKGGLYEVDPPENNRYRKDFIQKALINQGGFGKVYRSTYTYDMVDYAVKVISFTVTDARDTSKVLKEVQVYANLPAHANIVGYKTAWLEMEMPPSIDSSSPSCSADNQVMPVVPPLPSVPQGTSDDSSSGSTSTKTKTPSFTSFTSLTSPGTSLPPGNRGEINHSSQSDDIIFINGDSTLMTGNIPVTVNNRVQITELPDSPVTNDSLCTVFRNRTESLTIDASVTEKAGGKKADGVVLTAQRNRDSKDKFAADFARTMATEPVPQGEKVNRQGPIIKLYIQMELCKNENLKKWIKKRNKRLLSSSKLSGDAPLPYDEYVTAIEMFKQIVTGVDFLHHNHLIHRDLKPQNILFDLASGTVLKIGDFGLATLNEKSVHLCDLAHDEDGACDHGCLSHTVTSTLSVHGDTSGQDIDKHTAGLGTTIYVAPEQKNTNNYNNKADMYPLGIMLLELLCPFNTDSEKARVIESLKRDRIIPGPLLTAYPSASRLILCLTSDKPSERPSASQLLRCNDIFPSTEQQILHLKDQLRDVKLENSNLMAQNEELKSMINELNRKLASTRQ